MSDTGDFGVFSRHSRNVALGGAATLSSLCFSSSRRREAVDDAGITAMRVCMDGVLSDHTLLQVWVSWVGACESLIA